MRKTDLVKAGIEHYRNQSKLATIDGFDRVVFVGDTHGDIEASKHVLHTYLDASTALVFLGDYVDRGPANEENVLRLLEQKLEHPNQVTLLQGNHENWCYQKFSPATFWEPLNLQETELYSALLTSLPYAAITPNGIGGLHGALPDVELLDDIPKISPTDDAWWQLIWGDYQPRPGQFLGDLGARPQFGEDRFNTLMERFKLNVLIRGHQPPAPKLMYDGRCITIICSCAHTERPREIIIADLHKDIKSAADLEIVEI